MKANWLSLVFITLTEKLSASRQRLWHWVYNRIATQDSSGQFLFMNYGYDSKIPVTLKPEDEANRYYIQLYEHLIEKLSLTNKDLAEIGCGRGGGGSYLLRYKNLQSYVGIDLSETAIAWCNKQFPEANAKWQQGSADTLPLKDESTDLVINVESSHCYPDILAFFKEVKRVLRPNGYFAFCDMRMASSLSALDQSFRETGLQKCEQEDITKEVVSALDAVSAQRAGQIKKLFPSFFQGAMYDFAGIKDTAVYQLLKNGEMKYVYYLMQKTHE